MNLILVLADPMKIILYGKVKSYLNRYLAEASTYNKPTHGKT
jgi:hypothetical protein